jgi:hypothetical protein
MTYSVDLLKLMGIEFAQTILEDKEIASEQKLWRGVLCNAIEDTMQSLSDRKTSIYKMEAHEWIINNDNDFQHVCYWSGFDPDLVKEKYLQAVKRGDIKFTEKQVNWIKYYRYYESYKKEKDKDKRKEYKKLTDKWRSIVLNSTTALVSTFVVSC